MQVGRRSVANSVRNPVIPIQQYLMNGRQARAIAPLKIFPNFPTILGYTQPHLAQCGVEGRDSLFLDECSGGEATVKTINMNKIRITKKYI